MFAIRDNMATNRQLAQQARQIRIRNREDEQMLQSSPRNNRGSEPPPSQFSSRQLAQQTRRNRDYEYDPLARRPLPPQLATTVSQRHRLGPCDVSCNFCRADHWIDERVQGSARSAPRFSTCCEGGAIAMDKFEDPPQPLYSLLMNSAPCIFLFDILC